MVQIVKITKGCDSLISYMKPLELNYIQQLDIERTQRLSEVVSINFED